MLTTGVVVGALFLATPGQWTRGAAKDPLVLAIWEKSGPTICRVGILTTGAVVAESKRPGQAMVYWQASGVAAFKAKNLWYYLPSTGQRMRAHPRSFESQCGVHPFE